MGAYECIAIPTNEAKKYIARMRAYGTSYRFVSFGVNSGGHDPLDPRVSLAVDPTATVMPGGPPLFGPEPIDSITWRNDFCETYVCKILPGEYQGEVSSIGLWAEIVYLGPSDPLPPALGYQFLAAVCNRPLLVMTGVDSEEFDVTLFF